MNIIDQIEALKHKFYNLESQLSDPDIISDMSRFKKVNQEYKDLKLIVDKYEEYEQAVVAQDEAKELLSDPEMKEMAREELDQWDSKIPEIEEELKMLLVPKDPDDGKDVIIEIRSGTGGDEASIFAGDLYDMYKRYFDSKGWKYKVLDVNEGTVGGYNRLSLEVVGDSVFGSLKFESGAHRVQRVPKTESQGRVHTSAATVVVMPKLELEDVNIVKSDLKVDTFRASGAGGQHVNKTESGVRFTHLPTGVVSESTDGRSQIQNREIALQRLIQKIRETRRKEFAAQQASTRRSLVGSGDRSDKIRTYNYPQNRVTDHRINLTLYSLDRIMNGDIQEIIDSLVMYENTERLKALEEEH